MEQQNVFFKPRLMATGPTPVPDFVQGAMNSCVHYHRGPAFAEIMTEVRQLLPTIFGTKQEALIFSGTGTLAMEGAICNFFNPGDEVLAIDAGKFGKRWADQARIYGCKVHEIFVERGHAVDVSLVEEALQKNANIRGVLVHASETSTGVRHDVKTIAALAKKQKDCLTLVDGVTAIGVFSLPMDTWGLDVVVAGSQKGMMLPPGISFAAASERAWARTKDVKNVRYYMDWRKEKKAAEENSGAFTSAVTLIGGLREVLHYFKRVGPNTIYQRNWKMAFSTREAAKAMGFELFVKNDKAVSPVCTPILAEGPFVKHMRDRFSLTMSGGQDELKGKIVRIGHMGYIDGWDVLSQLMGIGQVGRELGRKLNIEAGFETFWKLANSPEDMTPPDMRT